MERNSSDSATLAAPAPGSAFGGIGYRANEMRQRVAGIAPAFGLSGDRRHRGADVPHLAGQPLIHLASAAAVSSGAGGTDALLLQHFGHPGGAAHND